MKPNGWIRERLRLHVLDILLQVLLDERHSANGKVTSNTTTDLEEPNVRRLLRFHIPPGWLESRARRSPTKKTKKKKKRRRVLNFNIR